MKRKRCNKQQKNRISIPPLILLLILGVFLFLSINRSNTLVYANTGELDSGKNLTCLIYGLDLEKERISHRPKVITLKRGPLLLNIFTTSSDIQEVLRENDIKLESNDYISISTQNLVDGSIVNIVRAEIVVVENILDIPYQTETVKTNKYAQGDKVVLQEGVLGIKTERLLHYYEDGVLVGTELIEENIKREPTKEIVEVGTSIFSLEGIEVRGYDCPYWYGVVDSGSYSDEEKRWLKYIMYCESGCNAESNKSSYKGLFQWSPYWWSKQFRENIFDGHAQIFHTISKYRAGESTRQTQWPACNAKYIRTFGS